LRWLRFVDSFYPNALAFFSMGGNGAPASSRPFRRLPGGGVITPEAGAPEVRYTP